MADIDLGQKVGSLDVSPQLEAFGQVNISINNETSIHSSATSGRQLEFTNPWATQQIANDVRNRINGYQYQPLTANQAMLDPAAELGDGLTVNGTTSRLFQQEESFERRHLSTLAAPADEEIDHEYPYQSKVQREAKRADTKTKELEKTELDTRERLRASGISTTDPIEGLHTLATQTEVDDLGNEVATYSSRIDQTAYDITLEVQARQAADGTLNRSILKIESDMITLDTRLTKITGAVTVGDTLTVDRGITAYGGITAAGESGMSADHANFAHNVSVGGTLSTTNLKLLNHDVSLTTASVVTEFTQALGETAPTTEMTFLTTYASSITQWDVPAGVTITFSID